MALAVNVTVWREERPSRAGGITEDFMQGGEGILEISEAVSSAVKLKGYQETQK